MKPKPKYSWDNDKGITRNDKQVLQLMDRGSPVFRKHCGKILVAALNGEEEKHELEKYKQMPTRMGHLL